MGQPRLAALGTSIRSTPVHEMPNVEWLPRLLYKRATGEGPGEALSQQGVRRPGESGQGLISAFCVL